MHETSPERLTPAIEPLDAWLLVQPSLEEESRGRLVLPATVAQSLLERCIVLSVGSSITDLHPADVVLILGQKAIELRDGSRLVEREHVVARLHD